MYPALSLAKKDTVAAISLTSPNLRSGTEPSIDSCCLSDNAEIISVLIGPGATTLVVMFLDANSLASDLPKPTRPALEAA